MSKNKRFLVILLFTALIQIPVKAQHLINQELGTVVLTIPSFQYDLVEPSKNSSVYETFIKGKNFFKKIPYKGKKIKTKQDGNEEYHIDEYEIKVPKGIYKIVIKGVENYKLANFSVGSNEIIKFQIPQFRFAWDYICSGNDLILKTFNSEEPYKEQEKQYNKLPFKKVLTDVFYIKKPFEIAIQHCGKQVKGKTLHYKSAQLYYKNYYIAAEELIIDKNNLTLEALGDEKSSVLVQINGGEIEENQKFRLELGKDKMSFSESF